MASVGLLLGGCGGASETAEVRTGEPGDPPQIEVLAGEWDQLQLRGGSAGIEPIVVDREIITIKGGGYNNDSMLAYGFDLQSQTQRRLPAVPLGWRALYSVVGTEDGLIVWGGSGGGSPWVEGAIYLAASDSWEEIAASPLGNRAWHIAEWTGSEMVVWGGDGSGHCDAPASEGGAAYDPSRDSWRILADAPIRDRQEPVSVWTGDSLLLWGGTSGTNSNCDPVDELNDGAAYDPDADEWERIPRAPIGWSRGSTALWTGEQMLVWNGARLAAYNPETKRWRETASPPIEPRLSAAVAWDGERLLIWGGRFPHPSGNLDMPGEKAGDGAAYEPKTDAWFMLPPAPDGLRGERAGAFAEGSLYAFGSDCCDRQRLRPSARLTLEPQ